jgi:DNA-binding XRE family transcriptional regulator
MTTKTKLMSRGKRATKQISVPGLFGKGLVRSGKETRLELRERLRMTRGVFGRVVNVSERTIAKVEAEAEQVEKLRRPYNEVYRVYEALSEVVHPDSLGTWFATPNPSFGGLKPIEVIERGEIDRIWELAYRLRSGMPG